MYSFSFHYNGQTCCEEHKAYSLLHIVLICCTRGTLIPACVVVGLTTNQSGGGSFSQIRTILITWQQTAGHHYHARWKQRGKISPPAFTSVIQMLLFHDNCSSGWSWAEPRDAGTFGYTLKHEISTCWQHLKQTLLCMNSLRCEMYLEINPMYD